MADSTEDIPGASGINSPGQIPGSDDQTTPSSGQSFESYMQPEQGSTEGSPNASEGKSAGPIDLAAQDHPIGAPPTMDSILQQMSSTSSMVGDLQNQLYNNKDKLKLKQTKKNSLFRGKITSSNQNIRTAAQKAGVDPGSPPNWSAKKSPVEKFLALLGDSQVQLQNTQKMVTELRDKNGMISPGNLLLIQTKLARAQQELEYSSVLLTKAVDDIKQMFNIQI
ncbi:MAG: hypothetical protein AAF443_03010 [Chlamydiota bacterium]